MAPCRSRCCSTGTFNTSNNSCRKGHLIAIHKQQHLNVAEIPFPSAATATFQNRYIELGIMRFQGYRKLVMFNLHFSDLELICWVPALCAAQWEQNMPPEQLSCWPTSVNIETKILLLPYVLHWFIISYQITASPSCMLMVGRVLLIWSNLFLPTMSFLISATRHKPRPAPKERWHKWPATPLTWQIHSSCFRGSDQTNHASSSVNIDYCSTMMVTAARLLQGISTHLHRVFVACCFWVMVNLWKSPVPQPSWPVLQGSSHHVMTKRARITHTAMAQLRGLWKSSTINLQEKMDATGRSKPWGPNLCISLRPTLPSTFCVTLFSRRFFEAFCIRINPADGKSKWS